MLYPRSSLSWTDSMLLKNSKEINSGGKTTSNNNKDGAATPNNSRTGDKTTGIRTVDRWGQVR